MPDATTDPRAEYVRPNITIEQIRELVDERAGEIAADRPAGGSDRTKDGEGTPTEGDKAGAAAIIESIGRDFVALRAEGRSQAWAELEDRLMTNAHVLISGGLMSPKDWIGLAIDIEQFRKQDLGTTQLPGDFLKSWLSEPAVSDSPPVAPHLPKREKKAKKVRKETS